VEETVGRLRKWNISPDNLGTSDNNNLHDREGGLGGKMKAWMIKGPLGSLVPTTGNWYKRDAIADFVAQCDWRSESPTWKDLQQEGFSVVKVEIREIEK
jgi:hypothetical protein